MKVYLEEENFVNTFDDVSLGECNARYLFETEKEIDFNELIEFEGKYYTGGMFDPKRKEMLVREVVPDFENDSENYESNLKCPFCGFEDEDAFELPDSDKECECGMCGAILEYEREYEVTYNSVLVKKPNVVKIGE